MAQRRRPIAPGMCRSDRRGQPVIELDQPPNLERRGLLDLARVQGLDAFVFLFMLAFVAVYREVFETILFYIAMWSDQASTAILAGLVAGIAVLAAVAYWMLRMSRRLPIGRFFSISSILIAVMAVILIGKGVAALQEAGWISQTPLALPRIEWIGLYPTWQSLLAQVLVGTAAIVGFLANARSGVRRQPGANK